VPQISLAGTPPIAPRLEYFRHGSSEADRVTIEHSPFSIGRCETSNLRIDSAQVSREHAQIYQRGNIWTIRDLGSTNGTKVNGKAVRESFLSDGDILMIAETEITFVASSVTPFQRMATQPIQHKAAAKPATLLPAEVSNIRAWMETTLWQAIPLELANVVSLANRQIDACFAQSAKAAISDYESQLHAAPAIGRHYRNLLRRRTVETASAQPAASRVFVSADLAECESPDELFDGLEQLKETMSLDCELGVFVSIADVADFGAISKVCTKARNSEILLGYIDFQGSSAQVLELESFAPDYLLLSDKMLRGVTAGSQPLRRLELALTTCQQLCIKPVLPQCACQRTIELCQQTGYEFAVQSQASLLKPARQQMAVCANQQIGSNRRIELACHDHEHSAP
jgi:hypothetical protein